MIEFLEQINNRMYLKRQIEEGMEGKQTKVKALYTYYCYFVVYSFIGWVWETIFTSIDVGSLQRRGFLALPLLPIYGIAVSIIIYLFYNRGYSITRILIGSMLVTTVQEFITSWGIEKMFHIVLWNYSKRSFHFQGRVCLGATITFGVASVLIIRFVHPRVEKKVQRFVESSKCFRVCTVSLGIILFATLVKVVSLLS